MELFDTIQTVDSARLAEKLSQAAATPLNVMLEVKLSPEEAKAGVSPDDLPRLIEAVAAFPNLQLQGLMTMPPWSDEAEPSRPYFQRLRALALENPAGANENRILFSPASGAHRRGPLLSRADWRDAGIGSRRGESPRRYQPLSSRQQCAASRNLSTRAG
ncbi:MAG: alanine racemase [Bryobacteraceae bacterium]